MISLQMKTSWTVRSNVNKNVNTNIVFSNLTLQTANGTDYKETDKWNLYNLMDWCHQPELLKHSLSVHQACQHEGRLPHDHIHQHGASSCTSYPSQCVWHTSLQSIRGGVTSDQHRGDSTSELWQSHPPLNHQLTYQYNPKNDAIFFTAILADLTAPTPMMHPRPPSTPPFLQQI